jgi:hypothetical protein
MKKILLISAAGKFPVGAFRLVKQIAENETISVKGLFFSDENHEEITGSGFIAIAEPVLKRYKNESILLDGCRHHFAGECEDIGIRYSIHPSESTWDTDLFVKESRFSDLVLISDITFQTVNQQAEPNYFMEQVLRYSECPVVVVPEAYREIDRLAIAYDAGAESMFALKQFIYLFPYFTDHPSDIIHIKNDGTEDIPNRDLLLEYTKAHFDFTFASKLQFDPKKYFTTWVENKKNVILITGAYSRSAFSNTMRRSFAYQTIADHICPVFVAHTA